MDELIRGNGAVRSSCFPLDRREVDGNVGQHPSARGVLRHIGRRQDPSVIRVAMGRKSRAKAARRVQQRQPPTTSVHPPTTSEEWAVPPRAPWHGLAADEGPVVAPQPLSRDATRDPGQRLRSLSNQQRELLGEIEQEIRVLLELGHSWSTVGAALGISRQGARQRYRRLIDGPC